MTLGDLQDVVNFMKKNGVCTLKTEEVELHLAPPTQEAKKSNLAKDFLDISDPLELQEEPVNLDMPEF